MTEKLIVNPAVCDGFGFCAGILPEVIGLDEWGFPVVGEAEIPETLSGAARKAVTSCPRRALRVVQA